MTNRERLDRVFTGRSADRTPILGGWIAAPGHIAEIAGVSIDEYWEDPVTVSIEAYRILGTDGLIDVFVPRNRSDFRCVDANTYQRADRDIPLDECIRMIDELPPPETIEASFDEDAAYVDYRRRLVTMQERCGDIVYMPAQWSAGARITWYADYGYENFFMIVGLYPLQARKLMEVGGARGRCQSRLVARAVKEGLVPPAVLLGEDICSQQGPMVSPAFMEEHYAPQLAYGLEPLLAAGCKPVWHCDGDVRQILDMLLACGVQGLQGFQPECGMSMEYVVQKRTRAGAPLLIFGPLSVTTELPVCSADEIYAKTSHAIEIARGQADLVMFTANTINPDVPVQNIRAMYDAVHASGPTLPGTASATSVRSDR